MATYDDNVVTLGDTGITIKNYYLPGRARHIPYGDIVKAELIQLGLAPAVTNSSASDHSGPVSSSIGIADAPPNLMGRHSLRWVSFGHVESDECGAMNLWLEAAPHAEVVFNGLGCDVSLNDLCDRPPSVLGDGDTLDIGGRRLRLIQTPHVPHGWEAGPQRVGGCVGYLS